jgi:hypothetical protein
VLQLFDPNWGKKGLDYGVGSPSPTLDGGRIEFK